MKTWFFVSLFFVTQMSYAATINVEVKGLVCSLCAQEIKKKFSALPEIKTVQVDLNQKLVALETHGSKDLTDDKIKELVTESGFITVKIERKE